MIKKNNKIKFIKKKSHIKKFKTNENLEILTSNSDDSIKFNTEILVQLIKKKLPNALLWFVEMSWRKIDTYPFFINSEKFHRVICNHYHIPLSSNLDIIGKNIIENRNILKQDAWDIIDRVTFDGIHPRFHIHSLTAAIIFEDFRTFLFGLFRRDFKNTEFLDFFKEKDFLFIDSSDLDSY